MRQEIPPAADNTRLMSLSRSPSPRPGGGWSSPGLTAPVYRNGLAPETASPSQRHASASNVTWESAKAKSNGLAVKESTRTSFFRRQYRKLMRSLPQFHTNCHQSYAEKEKLGRGRLHGRIGHRLARARWMWARAGRKSKRGMLLMLMSLVAYMLWYWTCKWIRHACAR